MYAFLTRIEPDANMNRWYLVGIQPNLFGEIMLFRAWGSRVNSGMQYKQNICLVKEAAIYAARKVIQQKLEKGYILIHCAAELRPKESENEIDRHQDSC